MLVKLVLVAAVFSASLGQKTKTKSTTKRTGKVEVNAKAASPYTNCGCQCSSLTFRQNGKIHGNCKSPDQTGADWCYVVDDGYSTCEDKTPSKRGYSNPAYLNKYWSYEACATPICGSTGGYGGNSGGFGGNTGGFGGNTGSYGSSTGGFVSNSDRYESNSGGFGGNTGGFGGNTGGFGGNTGGYTSGTTDCRGSNCGNNGVYGTNTGGLSNTGSFGGNTGGYGGSSEFGNTGGFGSNTGVGSIISSGSSGSSGFGNTGGSSAPYGGLFGSSSGSSGGFGGSSGGFNEPRQSGSSANTRSNSKANDAVKFGN